MQPLKRPRAARLQPDPPPTGSPAGSFIELRGVTRTYENAAGRFTALRNVDLRLDRGAFVAVVGKSGSGKSTLLNMIAGIDRPTSGEVFVDGTAVHALREGRMASWRGRTVGVVFQFFQLLPTLTVLENVMLPMDFCGIRPANGRRERALEVLDRVGIAGQADKFPAMLSGGEQQRAAIARALANDPPILVADEPTGNLDSRTAEVVFDLFAALVAGGKTLVTVTHERDVARWASRVVTLADGHIVSDPRPDGVDPDPACRTEEARP